MAYFLSINAELDSSNSAVRRLAEFGIHGFDSGWIFLECMVRLLEDIFDCAAKWLCGIRA